MSRMLSWFLAYWLTSILAYQNILQKEEVLSFRVLALKCPLIFFLSLWKVACLFSNYQFWSKFINFSITFLNYTLYFIFIRIYSFLLETSDRPKQCFAVLPKQNRTSQSKLWIVKLWFVNCEFVNCEFVNCEFMNLWILNLWIVKLWICELWICELWLCE